MLQQTTLRADFARTLAEKDFDRIRELMHPEVDFRGMTPRRVWEASDPATIVSEILRQWFEDSDEIETLDKLETDAFADTERVGYRRRIGWMRVVCSGFRPV